MEPMWAYKKRKGFTILEESVVIAIIIILAIPLVTLLNQSIRAQVYGTEDIKGQYYANLIMQDFERAIRRAESGTIKITSSSTQYKVAFSCKDSDKNGNYTADNTYNYEIDNQNTDNSLFYKWLNNNEKEVFPIGLDKGIIKNFTIDGSNIDIQNGSPPYYVKVKIETSTGTILQKTIYLVNYYKQ